MKNILFRKVSVLNQVFFGVLFVPALLAGFLLAQPALASTYSKTVTQSSGPACDYIYKAYGDKIFGQSFFSTSSNITAIALKIARMDANSYISEIKICQGDFSTPNTYSSAVPDWNCDQPGQKPVVTFKTDSSIVPISYNPNWVDFDLPFPISVEPNKKHFILFKIGNANICIQNYRYRDYPYGQSRVEGTNANDLPFNIYYTTDAIDWSLAIPDKTNDLRQDDYYSSGYSVNLAWSAPSLHNLSGTSTYEIEYWPKLYNCQTDYGFGGIPSLKKQAGEYLVGPGQKSEAIVKDLNKNTSYCFALTSSNQYQQSEISNFVEASTNNNGYTEDLAINTDFCGYSYQASLYGQSFVTDQSNISSISLKMKNVYATPGQAYEIQLCQGEMTAPQWNQPGQDWDCKQPGQILLATTTTNQAIAFSTPDWLNFHFANPINISPNQKLFFIFNGQGVSVCGEKDYDKYLLGEARSSNNARDFAFRTFYDTGLQEKKRNPVIIVPGVIASYLNNATTSDEFSLGEEVWPNIEKMKGPFDDYLDYLELDKLNQEIKHVVNPTNILKNIEDLDFFAGLIQELKDNGYEEEKDLFVFPYDWRLNLNWTAGDSPYSWQQTLKQKIEKVKSDTGAQKVDIIAHSMGGLVVKNYIEKYSQDAEDNIGKFIDIATPHLGSPSVFKILSYGDNLGFVKNKYLIDWGLNEGKIKDISQNMPSAYQLLPSQKYFTYDFPWASKGYIYDTKYKPPFNITSGYLDYDESINYLKNNRRNDFLLGFSGDTPVNINNELHNRLDNLPEKDNYYNIIGCGADTYAGAKTFGIPRPLDPVRGDGTVPLQSAFDFGHKKYYVATSSHAFLPSFNGVRQLVVSILKNQENGFDFSSYDYLSQDMSVCPGVSGAQVGAHSPVELHIYDEYGNHTGLIENGDVEEGVPGVIYDILGEDKYAWLPDGRNYRVVNKATSSGELGVTIRRIENDQATEFIYFNSIPLLSASTVVDYNITNNQADYQVQLDSNGDGIVEENITPSSVLEGEQVDDSIAPTTTISIFGQSGDNGYYTSAIEVELIADDGLNGAGVLKIEYSLDDGQSWNKYEEKIIVSDDGERKILYYSTDKAGNEEGYKEIIIKIDHAAPEIIMLVPQEGQEIDRNEKVDIEYLVEDNFSGLIVDQDEMYFDGEKIYSKEVDLFWKKLGEHKVKIIAKDQAGNQVEKEVKFNIITTIAGIIADINRAYLENLINQKANNSLIKDVEDIQKYTDKYAKKEEKRQEIEKAVMDRCVVKKGKAWCDEKLGNIFNKIDYRLSKIQQKIVQVKYELILKKLELYEKISWITKTGSDIIKEDIKYLINNIK